MTILQPKSEVYTDVVAVIGAMNQKIKNDPGYAPPSVLCFCRAKITDRVRKFKEGFVGDVGWAVKSNPHRDVIGTVIASGVMHFDVASRGEIDLIRKHAPNADLHYNHPVKAEGDIYYALTQGNVRSLVVGSMAEFEKVKRVFNSAAVCPVSDMTLTIRLKAPSFNEDSPYNFDEKFGAERDDAVGILRECAQSGFKTGVTFHPGSQNGSPEFYPQMLEYTAQIVNEALPNGVADLALLNMGGGFPSYYPDRSKASLISYFKAIEAAHDQFWQGFEGKIICEPGRALVADSMSLLTRVTGVEGANIHTNDGLLYGSLQEPGMLKEIRPPMRLYQGGEPVDPVVNGCEYVLCGATCDSMDGLPSPGLLPGDVKSGDWIEFGLVGAYGFATQTDFNHIPKAGVVHVEKLGVWTPAHSGLDLSNALSHRSP